MIAKLHHMTSRDFLLLGCSVALLVVLLWPTGSARQLIAIRTDAGTDQQYSVASNDPSLQSLKRRIKTWEKDSSSRSLRVARWHHELADYYCRRIRGDQGRDIAQVSYTDSNLEELEHDAGSFWSELRDDAQIRIAKAQRDIRIRRDSAVLPVTIGPVSRSIGSPLAYPIALLAAVTMVILAVRRQQICPPIKLSSPLAQQSGRLAAPTVHLQGPSDWAGIRQPVEVLLWRGLYATTVGSATILLLITNLT